MLTGTDSLVLADFNDHHSLWHSGITDTRCNQLADSINIFSFAALNTDSPTRLPENADPCSPDVSLASVSLITSSEWQIHTTLSSDHLPILIGLQTTATLSLSPAQNLTALYNDSLKSCRLPSIWKTSLVISIPNPGKDSSQGTFYRPNSLLYPAAKVLEALILPSINEFLSPAKYQHGFRPRHSTTSALLQLTTDIETGVNQRRPPHRTVCVAIDLTATFDTVSHYILISKIAGSSLPPAIARWLSCYL